MDNFYHFIIIGGGTAGCVLANRLSLNPYNQVLLLEAGGTDSSIWMQMPAGISKMFSRQKFNWYYFTQPQKELHNRRIYWPRGKVLGGSSSFNAMIYTRGHRTDYDRWNSLGNPGWNYDEVLPYFKKAENHVLGENKYHGTGGYLHVENLSYETPLAQIFIDAAIEAGYPFNEDFDGEHQEGVGRLPAMLQKRRRCSTTGYLRAAHQRKNLTVITNALVHRILIEDKKAIGVCYKHRGKILHILTRGEVILCAGAINSPQLLLLSGIGSASHLAEAGITCVHELSGVGENLQDHLDITITYGTNTNNTLDFTLLEKGLALFQYLFLKTGPATSNGCEAGAFIKTSPQQERPDIQLMFVPANRLKPRKERGIGCHVCCLQPQSRGKILLQSTDPRVSPAIFANYLTCEQDIDTLIAGVKIIRNIFAHKPLVDYITDELYPGKSVHQDSAIAEFIRATAKTIYHPVGTCKMGNDALAVVDSRLKVHGVQGLRIVDASIMPDIVRGNTASVVVMIAEKGANMIIEDMAGTSWNNYPK